MTPPRTGPRLRHHLELNFPEYQIPEGFEVSQRALPEASSFTLAEPSDPEGPGPWLDSFRFFEPQWGEFLRMPEALARRVLPEVLLSLIPSWEDFVVQLANNFYAVDLDMMNMPLSRGSNLSRFSEWSDRRQRPDAPTLQVQPNTLAMGHGEIRPIQGRDESFITRVNVDYTPNLIYVLQGAIPDLEIDQFAAVDPPQMTYDWNRLPRSPITAIRGGNLNYENPGLSGDAPTTPFGSVRPAPPGGHDYWMFHFNPVGDTLIASLQESISDGHTVFQWGLGSLNLWAFLPTFGINDPATYQALGIPYNTFPRRFGDLIGLLWPQFTPEGRQIREDAPLINPNTEYYAQHYMDSQGRPQSIPENSDSPYTPHYELRYYRDGEGRAHLIPTETDALQSLNRSRVQAGLPPVQGGIWRPIPEVAEDLDRINEVHRDLDLAAITRMRRRRIPINRREVVRLNQQIQALNRREHLSIDLISASRGPAVDWIGLDLARDSQRFAATPTNQLPRAVFRAMMREVLLRLPIGSIQSHEGTQFTIRYTLNPVTDEDTGEVTPRFGIQVTFHPLDLGPIDLLLPGPSPVAGATSRPEGSVGSLGIRAQGLQARRITVDIPDITQLVSVMGQSDRNFGERLGQSAMNITLEGVQTQDLRIDSNQFQIALDRGRIRQVQFHSDGTGWRTAIRGLRAHNLTVGGQETELQLQAARQTQDIFISQQGNGRLRARMDLHGGIGRAQLIHPTIGELNFTTLDPEQPDIAGGCEGRDCPNGGRITFESGQEGSERSFGLNLELPYFGIWTASDALMQMERGSSSIRNATVRVSEAGMDLEGDLDINASMPRGLGTGPTQLFEANTRLNSQIENLRATGRVRVNTFEGGWRIQGPSETNPLNLSFSLANSSFHHEPAEFPPYLRGHRSRQVVQTDMAIEGADVRLENFREARYRQVEVNGESQGRLEHLESGPITVNNIRGQGNIWVNLVIWGFVRGLFPQLGNRPSQGAITRRRDQPALPNRAPLLQHLPEAVRNQLGEEDFLRIGGVRMHSAGLGEQSTQIDDILLHIHETGGRGQFGLLRVPQVTLGRREGAPFWQMDPRFIVNIFLNSPPRGGSFHFVRWPER